MVEVAVLPGNDDQAKIGFGGDTLNTAIYMARLGGQVGFDVCYVSLLGDDPYGDAMLRAWRTSMSVVVMSNNVRTGKPVFT